MVIIGTAGLNASGKGEVGNYLESKGFIFLSLSDAIREELTKEGKDHSRQNMIDKGNELRQKYGAGILDLNSKSKPIILYQNLLKKHDLLDFVIQRY